MKRPAVMGLLTACAALVTACSSPALDAAPAAPEPATQPAASAIPATSSIAPTSRFGDWSMPKPGPMDPNIKSEQLFRACRDIPDHVAQKLGIVLERDREEVREPFDCPFHLQTEMPKGTAYTVSSWKIPLDTQLGGKYTTLEHRVAGFEKAVTVRSKMVLPDKMCETMVETNVGVIGITYINYLGIPSGQAYCSVPEKLLVQLFGRNQDNA